MPQQPPHPISTLGITLPRDISQELQNLAFLQVGLGLVALLLQYLHTPATAKVLGLQEGATMFSLRFPPSV